MKYFTSLFDLAFALQPFHAMVPALQVLFAGPKCCDARTVGTVYLLSLRENCQPLHLAHRLNMYCSYNYCKYVLHIIIAQVLIRSPGQLMWSSFKMDIFSLGI